MSTKPEASKKKGIDFNPYITLFIVIVVCGLLSFVVAPGAFDREVIEGRTFVVPGSYHAVEKTFISLFDIFRAIPNGLIGSASIVFLVLIVGGAVEVFNRTGTIPTAISRMVNMAGQKAGSIVLVILFAIFAVLGGFLGWIEAAIPFVPLVVPIVLALGYDSLTAVGVVILGSMVGFAVGPTNMYTVGIAHQVAQMPMFSGFGFRFIVYLVFCAVALVYLMIYAERTKKDPSRSLVSGIDVSEIKQDYSAAKDTKLTTGQTISLVLLVGTFVVVVYGMMELKWGINDMTAAFFLAGAAAGLLCRMAPGKIAATFIDGAKVSMGGAMIVGVARGVEWILTQGGMLDPIINALSSAVSGLPKTVSAIGMMVVVILLDGLFSSGSGKAVALMPIIIPLGDLSGLSRQVVTLAYQLGDGVSNMAWFTYGTLLIFLAYGKVPLKTWYKFLWKLIVILYILSILFLFIAVAINYQ